MKIEHIWWPFLFSSGIGIDLFSFSFPIKHFSNPAFIAERASFNEPAYSEGKQAECFQYQRAVLIMGK